MYKGTGWDIQVLVTFTRINDRGVEDTLRQHVSQFHKLCAEGGRNLS